MNIYNYDTFTGEYIGPSTADESPLEPGVFLIPANSTTIAPPASQDGKTVNFENGVWVLNDIPVPPPEPTPELPTYAELRAREYPAIGDQLDALFHAGVFPPEMAALIQAVKDKYPKGA
jgi:hypothetical protein